MLDLAMLGEGGFPPTGAEAAVYTPHYHAAWGIMSLPACSAGPTFGKSSPVHIWYALACSAVGVRVARWGCA